VRENRGSGIEGKQPRLELPLDCRRRRFSGAYGKNWQQIPPGRTRTYSQVCAVYRKAKAFGRLREPAARNPCPSWYRAIASFAKTGRSGAIAGAVAEGAINWRRRRAPRLAYRLFQRGENQWLAKNQKVAGV